MTYGKITILGILFLLLGGYVFLFESTKEENEPIEEEAKNLIVFEPDDVFEIELVRNGENILFRKEGEGWKVKKPVTDDVREDRIRYLLKVFDYGFIEMIDQNPSDIEQYGLAPPEMKCTIRLNENGNKVTHTILFGSENPSLGSIYCKLEGSPSVYLVGTLYRQEIEKDVSFYIRK